MNKLAITAIVKDNSAILTPKELEHIYVTEFDEASAEKFYQSFRELQANDEVKVIPVIIDSFGGYAHSLLVMLDLIASSHKPVATIGIGKAMSCGAFLLAAGTKGYRFSAENTDIMIHEVASGARGKITDTVNDVNHIKKLNDKLFRMFAGNSKKDVKFFLEKMKSIGNADWFLTSKEFKTLGLIDHIGIPMLVQK